MREKAQGTRYRPVPTINCSISHKVAIIKNYRIMLVFLFVRVL